VVGVPVPRPLTRGAERRDSRLTSPVLLGNWFSAQKQHGENGKKVTSLLGKTDLDGRLIMVQFLLPRSGPLQWFQIGRPSLRKNRRLFPKKLRITREAARARVR
jgi:hypothetical protein